MLEVELKFRADSPEQLTEAVAALGAAASDPIEQVDQYFAHPCRDFAETDEALRLRSVGSQSFVTYKGPKLDAATKTRREVELPLQAGASGAEQFGELLGALGFLPVATVRKARTTHRLKWQSHPVEVAVDAVDGLGTFIEIETAVDEANLAAARDAVLSLAKELGLEASERRSYLELLLASRAG